MRNKLFYNNVLYCGLIHTKVSSHGLPTWSYCSYLIFQGFYKLWQVSMAASFGCEEDSVLSCEKKLFCRNVLYFGLIYSKLSAHRLPAWRYFSCQIFQGFYRLQQVLMAAGFGCEKDCVLSCEASYFAVMFCILAGFTPSCLPIDSQHGVISLAKSSKDFTDCSRF